MFLRSSRAAQHWVVVVSSWRAQGHIAGFPKTKAFSLKCMATKDAFLASVASWLIQITMMTLGTFQLQDSVDAQ